MGFAGAACQNISKKIYLCGIADYNTDFNMDKEM